MNSHRTVACVLALAALVAPVQAQSLQETLAKAPATVEAALTARVKELYQCLVEGRFRQGENYVAEDAKEYYYNSPKQRPLSYQIISTEFLDNKYEHAKVAILVEVMSRNARFPSGMKWKLPVTTHWKVENGQWAWYVESSDNQALSAFRAPGQAPEPSSAPGAPAAGTSAGSSSGVRRIWVEPAELAKQIKVTPTVLELVGDAAGEITFHNNSQGQLTLALPLVADGVKLYAEKLDVAPGESVKIQVRPTGKTVDVAKASFDVQVQPFMLRVPVSYSVKPQAGLAK